MRKLEPGDRRDSSILAGAEDQAPIAVVKPTAPDTVLRRRLLASYKLIDDATLDAIAQAAPMPARNGG